MPNLVFIMSDEARKDVVFHDKYPFVRTPNIDSLRGEAVSFHHCFANYPVCVPSRSSMITGRYPHQIGVLRNSHHLPADERDLGHHLSVHGFDCVSFGKTHNTNHGFRSITYDQVATMGFENHGYIEDPDLITGVFEGAADEYCDFVACRQFRRLPAGARGRRSVRGVRGHLRAAPAPVPATRVRGPLLGRRDRSAATAYRTGQRGAAIDPDGPAPPLERLSRRDPARGDRQLSGADHAARRLRATDPGETVNRYDDPAYRDRRQELLEEIARFLIRHPRVPDRGGNGFFG